MESTARQSQPLDFFSDERAEFIDFDEGVGLGLWWAGGECLGGLRQTARDGLVIDPENPPDGSHPHPFEIEWTGLLLEGGIFASSYCLKDPSAGLATVALDTPVGALANRVRMSAVRTLHGSFSKS